LVGTVGRLFPTASDARLPDCQSERVIIAVEHRFQITIGSLHEISIAFRHTWLESFFHADSHGIFYFFFKSTEMCVFLI
jgi:hypothetical protein